MSTDPNVPEQFASLDPATGHATLIGSPLAQRTRIMPLIVAPDGTIYAAGIFGPSANKLLTIDRYTGQATEVGPFGVTMMMDLAYNSEGVLYGATQTALYTIDTTTGAATAVATFSGDLIVGTAAKVMGITFAPDGSLYATDFVLATAGNSSLYRVDAGTGVGVRIANTHIAQIHSADVQPPSPAERMGALADKIQTYGLNRGIARSFIAKLDAANAALTDGVPLAACDALTDFDSELAALAGKKLTDSQASALKLDLTWTETSLNCPK